MRDDDVIDDLNDLTDANVEAMKLAKQIGGRLAIGFVVVLYVAFMLFLIFNNSELEFLLCSIGSLVTSVIAANYLGGKIGQQVLVHESGPYLRSIFLSLILSAVAGCTGGILLTFFGGQFGGVTFSRIAENLLGFALISLLIGAIPSLILGFIYSRILESYKSRFNYVDSEEIGA